MQQLIEQLISEIVAPGNYLDIGHPENISDFVELWIYSNGAILTVKDTGPVHLHQFLGQTYQAQGRIDFSEGAGSIAFLTWDEHRQRVIIKALRDRFPLIEFWVFSDEEEKGIPLEEYEGRLDWE